jgi:hypothetical protein
MAKPAAPSKSPQQILNEEAIAKRRAAYQESLKADAKPVLEDVEAGKMTAEQAAAELAKRWGTPSDAERRFPPNKSGLPSNPPTARKARGKVSDLADMPIEPTKPVEAAAPETQEQHGKLSSLAETKPRSLKDPASMRGSEINKEIEKLEKESSVLTRQMIEAGRGSERYNEIATKSDPLAKMVVQNADRAEALRNEIRLRTGDTSRISNVGRSPRIRP